jgi:DNA-directed RNA polymerase subunit RPC12/RpoP
MRLRCPHQGCSIEVADDMLGARIRCPHCDQLLFVDPAFQEDAAAPAPIEAGNLENRLYAGVPPLSLMLALRAGRPPLGKDDAALRAEMTPEDWTALAAFETIFHAIASLKTALWFGIIAVAVTGMLWTGELVGRGQEGPSTRGRLCSVCVTLTVSGVCLLLMELGRRRLQRLQIDRSVGLVAWSALSVALVFGLNVLLNLFLLFEDRYGLVLVGLPLFAIPFQVVATLLAAKTSFLVQRVLDQATAPEILNRLVEALKYLE